MRIGGADHDRTTGNAIWAKCIHRTTRPVSGRVDPHWHCHALLFNATYDVDRISRSRDRESKGYHYCDNSGGQGAHQPIGLRKESTVQSARVADDEGQKNAVYHVLRSCDLLTGIEGKPGVGNTSTKSEAAAAIRSLTSRDPIMLAQPSTAETVL